MTADADDVRVEVEEFDAARLARLGRRVLELEQLAHVGGPAGELGVAAARIVCEFVAEERRPDTDT